MCWSSAVWLSKVWTTPLGPPNKKNTDRVVLGGGRRRGRVLLVAVGDDVGGGRLGGGSPRDVAVILGGQHHGGLVRLRVLVVQVDHAAAAVRHGRHAAREKDGRGNKLWGGWRFSFIQVFSSQEPLDSLWVLTQEELPKESWICEGKREMEKKKKKKR